MYYQFLKHQFPLDSLPSKSSIKVLLDNHSAQKNKNNLEQFLTEHWTSNKIDIQYIKSSKKNHIQAIDLIIGMSGFKGNQICLKAQGSQKKQKLKKKFCKHIYDRMREVDKVWRGSKVLQLFETTSKCGYKDSPFSQRLAIWKFIPKECYKDKGWENDHLSSKGEYQGPDIHYRCEKQINGKNLRDKRYESANNMIFILSSDKHIYNFSIFSRIDPRGNPYGSKNISRYDPTRFARPERWRVD